MRVKRTLPQGGQSAATLVYCAGDLYSGGDDVIDDLRCSGFTAVVAWAVHVSARGDLIYNEPLIVKDGQYVGDPAWPRRLASLKKNSASGSMEQDGCWRHSCYQDSSDKARDLGMASDSLKQVRESTSNAQVQQEGSTVALDSQALLLAGDASNIKRTSVTRLLFSIGGWLTGDFIRIRALIQQQGTGPGSILYQNFKALKEAIPDIDAIDLDNEDIYDKDTTVQFSRMLHDLGFEVTFCPYEEPQFWLDCLHTLNSETPGLVTNFLLQCYAGGSYNDPSFWIDAVAAKMGGTFDAAGFVFPGLWCIHGEDYRDGDSPEEMEEKFAQWRTYGVIGGFLWVYDDIQNCSKVQLPWKVDTGTYARAIADGLTGVNRE